MDLIVIGYMIYLPVTLLLIYWVARTLFKNSQVFMLDIFRGRTELATATNRLFEIGFYLLNIGMALYILKMNHVFSVRNLIEALSTKMGGFIVYLGLMVFFNLFLFFRGKKKIEQVQ
jgi:hypothetical protein